MDELCDYLRSRHVPEESIERMEKDKIDAKVIPYLTDEQLKEYLPSYGDRVAVFGYCRQKEPQQRSRRSNIFERLKGKLTRKQMDNGPEKNHQAPVNLKNAQKNERKIELGWMHFREGTGSFVQMRTKKGGGTRKESVSKDCNQKDLIEKAVLLFFPGGKNAEGSFSDFDIDITDFQQHPLDDNISVGELYETVKLPLLRFYLATKKREAVNIILNETSEATVEEQEKSHDEPDVHHHSPDALDVVFVESSTFLGDAYESNSHADANVNLTGSFIHVDVLDDSDIVTIRSENLSGVDYAGFLDDTLPLTEELQHEQFSQREEVKKLVVLHRGQMLKELIEVFTEENIIESDICFKVVLPDGKLEKAVDDGGVLRDVLSEFWIDFYEQCTMGNEFKIPYLRHDFGKAEWESIGRIILFGWQKEKHLPIKLAPVLLEQAVLGVVESDVVDSFLKYVSESERIIFESCRTHFDGVDQDELLEIMDIHNCRRLPTAVNFEQILMELAHQKLIQEPSFVIEQWSNMLAPVRSELKGIRAAYDTLQPTSRKIIKSLTYPSAQNAQEKQIVKYVNAYLRESDTQHLSYFLRLCTGSNLFTEKTISVTFTQLQGFQRRPVAHTCGCFLELPVNYDSYPDFRHEMNKVLESNVWVMDIV